MHDVTLARCMHPSYTFRCGHLELMLLHQLQRVDYAQQFAKIASTSGRIEHHHLDLFRRIENVDAAARQRHALTVDLHIVDHAELIGKLSRRIGNDLEGKRVELRVGLDVFDPAAMIGRRIARDGDHFHVALPKLVGKLSGLAQFGGADGRVVGRMREEDGPAEKRKIIGDKCFSYLSL